MRSVAIVYALDVLAKSLLVVTGFLLVRLLNEAEYASYTLATAIIAVATQAVSGSLNRIYIAGHREFAADQPPGLFLGLQVWTVLVPLTAVWAVAGRGDAVNVWILLSVVATCFLDFSRTCFQQRLSFTRFAGVEVARATLLILFLALPYLVGMALQARHALAAQSVSMLLVFLAAFGHEIDWRDVTRAGAALRLASRIVRGEFAFLFAYFFLTAFWLQAEVFALKLLGHPIDVASFGAATRYALVLTLALNALTTVLFPLLQRIHTQEEIRDVYRRHRQVLLMFVPAATLAAVVAPQVLPLIDGGKYPEAVPTFQILCVANVSLFVFAPYGILAMRFHDFGFLLGLAAASALLDVGLNITLIPRNGPMGAAIALTIAHTVLSVATCIRARRRLSTWLPSRHTSAPNDCQR